MKKLIATRAGRVVMAMILGVLFSPSNPASAVNLLGWDKMFPQSDKVVDEKVTYYNRLGINIVADLYVPKNLDRSKKAAALVVGHPFGGVKEQTSGLYAQTMAERGFVTLAFDAAYTGESGGQPREIASPESLAEDFNAAVDFLGTRPFVDRNRIGIIGLCGLGGFSIAATAIDTRVKALATVVMYDTTRQRRQCSRKPARSWHIITSHKNRWTSTKSLTWSALTTPTRSSAPFNVGRVSRRTVGVAAA